MRRLVRLVEAVEQTIESYIRTVGKAPAHAGVFSSESETHKRIHSKREKTQRVPQSCQQRAQDPWLIIRPNNRVTVLVASDTCE